MATATPIFPQTIVNSIAQIQNSTAQALVTLVTGGANGTKIESITATSTDTSARDVALWITISSVNYLLTTISIPATAGSVNNIISVDMLRSSQFPSLAFDTNGNRYIYIANGSVLSVACLTTVTSAKLLQFFAQGGNY